MPTYRGGRHEHGQNHLIDHTTIDVFVGMVADTSGPIVEIGPGNGALTQQLAALGRPLTAVEIDERQVAKLRRIVPGEVEIVNEDFLRWRLPRGPFVVVGNVPFHLTTAILRKLLHDNNWTQSVLLVQWEVARRRAGVGGASMMTAQWWPWVDFGVAGRVSRTAFRPSPSVDGGLLSMTRRPHALVTPARRSEYRHFVHDVFTGRGHGLASVLSKLVVEDRGQRAVRGWLVRENLQAHALPKDLTARQWAELFELAGHLGRRRRKTRPDRGPRR